MTSLSALTTPNAPVRIVVVHIESDVCSANLNHAALIAPCMLVKQYLGATRFELSLVSVTKTGNPTALETINKNTDLALLVAEPGCPAPAGETIRKLAQYCQQARYWGGVGAPVLWLACSGKLRGLRAALPWAMYPEINEEAEQAILVPNLFELDGTCLTCCGGTASLDFSLTLIHALFGAELQAQVMESLCIERVRSGDERQRIALQTRFGALQPQLSEAVTLMENNIEETLSTDEIAQLVGLSRRQLERQFKQYLGTMPSRYYLELRLKKARQLLLESNSSIVQIGLMCGFSSGAHFSTAFGAQFGVTPREERQKKLSVG